MIVNDGHHVGPRLVDLAVDESLPVAGSRVADGLAVEIVFDDVGRRHQARREGARKKIMIGIRGIAQADVAVAVQDAFRRQDVIGGHQVVNQRPIAGLFGSLRRARAGERQRGGE